MTMEMNIKCTSCGKSRPATPEQIAEARKMGCFFSACCQAVATVNAVTIKRMPPKKRAANRQRANQHE